MLKQNAVRTCAVIAACTATTLISTGCRSMPGAGLFASRGPSAEALAGSGPSTTYPVPPSHTATPEAIASIAGGTAAPRTPSGAESATAQVAGIEISPGYALPAGANPNAGTTNMAAAAANGAYARTGNPAASPPSFATSPSPPTATSPSAPATSLGSPSGYAFGSKALTPKPDQPTFAATTSAGSDTNFAPTFGPLPTPSTDSAELPATSYTQPPAGGGFTLPSDAPAMAAITPPEATVPTSPSMPMPSEITAPSFAPSFSTAQAPVLPSASLPSNSGYTPGSTGSAAGYPTSDTKPTTNGSFYR